MIITYKILTLRLTSVMTIYLYYSYVAGVVNLLSTLFFFSSLYVIAAIYNSFYSHDGVAVIKDFELTLYALVYGVMSAKGNDIV
jgi:hypothetical protein